MERTLDRVYFCYNDGVQVLEGESLKIWLEAAVANASITRAHNGVTGFEKVTWKDITEPVTLVPK